MKLRTINRVTVLPAWMLVILGRHDAKYGGGAADARISRWRMKLDALGSRAAADEERKTHGAREEAAILILKLRTAESALDRVGGIRVGGIGGVIRGGGLSDPASIRAERTARAENERLRRDAERDRSEALDGLVKLREALASSDVLLDERLLYLEKSCGEAEAAYLAGVRRRLPDYAADSPAAECRARRELDAYKTEHAELEGMIKKIVRGAHCGNETEE